MKKITLVILVLFIFVMATPASAARELPTVGEHFQLMFPNVVPPAIAEYPANTPFYDYHGWWVGPGSQAIGVFDFKMEIVGRSVGPGLRYIQPNSPLCGGNYCVFRIYNFPQGLPEGTYTFVGNWYIPCQYGPNPSDCSDPNQAVINQTVTTTIIFK